MLSIRFGLTLIRHIADFFFLILFSSIYCVYIKIEHFPSPLRTPKKRIYNTYMMVIYTQNIYSTFIIYTRTSDAVVPIKHIKFTKKKNETTCPIVYLQYSKILYVCRSIGCFGGKIRASECHCWVLHQFNVPACI